ncbi:hypothetical protein [Phytohabitans houttuyneae]|uniref:Uncharacterized protein n=1 Tax=Phytohabitans houttuyneae TaxID=1076126 RepID=A0A6V8KT10_9ACTN|nr:hypothetical protein [Phytohabitans houttuyneae]GFJ83735.1 hypothetical protein Phou_079150 [Phytohabitans houttuyneae]
MSRKRIAARAGLVTALVVSVLLGVAVQPASATPAPTGPTGVPAASDGTTVTRTTIGTYAGEEYVAEQTVAVAAAVAPQALCPAPPPGAARAAMTCLPPVRCRTMESTYIIYVIPTYQTLVRWRVHYQWCWEGPTVISATHTETTPDILSSTIRVSGSITRRTTSVPALGSVDVFTEGLQFDVVILGVSVKAFNPKLRFVLTSSGMAYNLSVLA